MRAQAVAVLLGVALLAGCLGQDGADPDPPSAPAPEAPLYTGTCENALLFQFVDYSATDPFLPPGFHPRDPQDFLNAPVAFGSAGVLFISLDCTSEMGGRMASGSVDIFVEAPFVPGVDPAGFNFYEVERYADAGQFGGVLDQAGWKRTDGAVDVNLTFAKSNRQTAIGTATVQDSQGEVIQYYGAMTAPVPLNETVVRFWHDGPAGLAYIEYATVLATVTGSGSCTARPGTPMAAFLHDGTVPSDLTAFACPPGEPLIATFPDMAVAAEAHFLPGVHAG